MNNQHEEEQGYNSKENIIEEGFKSMNRMFNELIYSIIDTISAIVSTFINIAWTICLILAPVALLLFFLRCIFGTI